MGLTRLTGHAHKPGLVTYIVLSKPNIVGAVACSSSRLRWTEIQSSAPGFVAGDETHLLPVLDQAISLPTLYHFIKSTFPLVTQNLRSPLQIWQRFRSRERSSAYTLRSIFRAIKGNEDYIVLILREISFSGSAWCSPRGYGVPIRTSGPFPVSATICVSLSRSTPLKLHQHCGKECVR